MCSVGANSLKNKVVIIMGATGAGKSRLSIDLATSFPSEIINSDKIQVYKGLDIVSNKVPVSERKDVPHHLLGEVEQDANFDSVDFCRKAALAMENIVQSGKVPIIVGGSNSFLEALVEDPVFKSTYKCFFIWMDVSFPVLYSYVSKRVDQMVDSGLIDEVRGIFDAEADYSKGIRRAIGVPEMHEYLLAEKLDKGGRDDLLACAIDKIKNNTCYLVCRQFGKIKQLRDERGWDIYRIDATSMLEKTGEDADKAWNDIVLQPCLEMVIQFLIKEEKNIAT